MSNQNAIYINWNLYLLYVDEMRLFSGLDSSECPIKMQFTLTAVCIMVNIYALITKSVSTVHHRKFNEVQWF
jgi:hypothetical protein